jgi:hypothetical protein
VGQHRPGAHRPRRGAGVGRAALTRAWLRPAGPDDEQLLAALLAGLSSAGARAVHLDVHPENRRVAAILRGRLGGAALAWDAGLLTVDLPLAAVLRAPLAVA